MAMRIRAVGGAGMALCVVVMLALAACSGGSPDRPGRSPDAGPKRGESRDCPTGRAIADGDLVSRDTLWSWMKQMVDVGFRHTGSRAHRNYIDMIAGQLTEYGLTVRRYPTPLDYWEAKSWSLEVTDAEGVRHDIPVAYYRPYSGETPPQGVTAPMVDVGAAGASEYAGTDVRGRIVLADLGIQKLEAGVIGSLSHYTHPPAEQEAMSRDDYTRIWLGIPRAPDLAEARDRGAVAMINILDMSPELARGQFYPHQQVYAGLPALHLDRVQGAKLREMLDRGPVTATVRLVATKERTTVDYLTAELPGAGVAGGTGSGTATGSALGTGGTAGAGGGAASRADGGTDGDIMVLTHTDGQNAIEENGVPVVLAMAEYFTRFAPQCRPRNILFVLSAVHMTAHEGATHSDVFLQQHPEITKRVAAALVPEHLGGMEWVDDRAAGTYRPTGATELMAIPVGHSQSLQDLAIDEVKASDLRRTSVLGPFRDGLYGEGTGPYKVGIPTVAIIGGPAYLLQVTPDGNLDKIDRGLLHRQTALATRLLARMLEMSRFK